MAINKRSAGGFNYDKAQKLNKNFMYKDLKRSNCYNSNFTGSNFDYTSFRGAHFKSCDFHECTFRSAEFVGANFKKSKFRKARFENAIFDSVNLEGADFRDAVFINTIFIFTDVKQAAYLNIVKADVKIFDEMPKLTISEDLNTAVKEAMNNEFIKASRTLDTKTGEISPLSIMILLENFDEETLIKGLQLIGKKLDKSFCTLSYIINYLKGCESQGMI